MNNQEPKSDQVKAVGSCNTSKNNALFEAIRMRSINNVRFLLNAGSNPNTVDDNGETPLHLAVQTSCLNISKMLIDSGAQVNAKNEFNFTPVRIAVKSENVKMTQLLIDKSADLNVTDDLGYTPLFVAVEMKNIAIVDLLLKAGANANTGDNDGHTPVHEAVLSKDLNIMKLLLDSGADAKKPNKSLVTPLHFAESSAAVKILLEAGADPNAKDINGNNSLHTVARTLKFSNLNVFKLLVNGGGNVNELNNDGDTCFSLLYKNIHLRQLLEGVRYDVSPLFFCITPQKETIKEDQVKKLLRYSMIDCVDVNLVDRGGRNILVNILQSDFVSVRKKKDLIAAKFFSKLIIEYVARVRASNLCISLKLTDAISNMKICSDYYQKCLKELENMKSKKFVKCDVRFVDLLDEYRLLEFASSKDLIKEFNKTNVEKKFPIFGKTLKINMTKGINDCKSFSEAASNLSNCIPIFQLNNLIVKDILDTVSAEDWNILSKKKRHLE